MRPSLPLAKVCVRVVQRGSSFSVEAKVRPRRRTGPWPSEEVTLMLKLASSFFKSSPVAPSLIIVSQRDGHDQTWAIQSSAPMFVFLGETHTPAKRARNKGPSSCALQAKLSLSGSILDEERKFVSVW